MYVPPYAYWHTWKRNTCCDVISRGLHHIYARIYPAATQKGVADLCLCQLATMCVQMHVHKIFSLRITIKAACASGKHDNQMTIK